MSAHLDVIEIFDFAILLEQKGYEFYTESAKKFNHLKLMQFFHLLAEEEMRHENIFKKMKEKIPPHTSPVVNENTDDVHLRDYLKGFVFSVNQSIREKVKNLDSIEEVIQLALGIEKNSVVFYSSLKKYMEKEHVALIEEVIQEEISHVIKLQKFKAEEIPPPPDVDAL